MSEFNIAALGLDLGVKEDEVQKGSSRPQIPAGTYARRVVGVVELGTHEGEWQGVVKDKHPVLVFFELFGKQLPEWKDKDGKPIPFVEKVEVNKSFSENGGFLPLFNALNHEGKAKNLFQLLGTAGRLKMVKKVTKAGKEIVVVDPKSISSPVIEVLDEDGMATGEFKTVKVPEATEPFRVFQWATGNQAQFDTLPYWVQEQVVAAKNFKESFPNGFTMKPNPRGEAKESPIPEGVKVPEEPPAHVTVEVKAPAADPDEFEFDA